MIVISSRNHNLRRASAAHNGGVAPRVQARWLHRPQLVPHGFERCLNPLCKELIPKADFEERHVTCPVGHGFDLLEEFYALFEPGGKTLAGLTLKEMGDIGEDVVRTLGDLGEFGRIIQTDWDNLYQCPLDFATDKNLGGEIKTLCWLAQNHRFFLSKRKYRLAKDAFAALKGFDGIVGVLVILNFETSMAEVYPKAMSRLRSFVKPKKPFATVAFDNPLEAEFARVRAVKSAIEKGLNPESIRTPEPDLAF